jgi:uncharacterized RDD family membrane protein YckC
MEKFTYGGFGQRVAAVLIDVLVLILPVAAGHWLLANYIASLPDPKSAANGLGMLIFWIYFAVMESSPRQATFGKQAMGLKVVDMNGDRISFMRALGRAVGKLPSALIVGIGFLMSLFTERRQCLHDMMAGCLVIREEGSIESLPGETQSNPVPIPKGSRIIEDDKLPEAIVNAIYAHVAKEIAAGHIDSGLWARAEVESLGDTSKTRIAYTKLRVQDYVKVTLAKRQTERREAERKANEERLREDDLERQKREDDMALSAETESIERSYGLMFGIAFITSVVNFLTFGLFSFFKFFYIRAKLNACQFPSLKAHWILQRNIQVVQTIAVWGYLAFVVSAGKGAEILVAIVMFVLPIVIQFVSSAGKGALKNKLPAPWVSGDD